MAVELNKTALAVIGLFSKVQEEIEGLIEDYTSKDEDEKAEKKEKRVETRKEFQEKSLSEKFEELVELGELKYDEWLDKGKKERENLSDKVKERINKLFAEIGLVTKEDLEELDSKITRLEKMAKKAAAHTA